MSECSLLGRDGTNDCYDPSVIFSSHLANGPLQLCTCPISNINSLAITYPNGTFNVAGLVAQARNQIRGHEMPFRYMALYIAIAMTGLFMQYEADTVAVMF